MISVFLRMPMAQFLLQTAPPQLVKARGAEHSPAVTQGSQTRTCPWWGWSDGTKVLLKEPLADFSWEQQVHGTVAREFCKYSRGRQECDGERGNEVRARPGSEGMGLLCAGAGSGCPALLHLPQGSRGWLAGGHWHTLAGGKQFLFCTQEQLPRDRRRWRHSHRLFSWMPSSPRARESILVGHRARE